MKIAADLGVSDAVIGLTIVAVGTSFPVRVTFAVAPCRKDGDIALGNVLGSNICNILFIGGVMGVTAPTSVPAARSREPRLARSPHCVRYFALACAKARPLARIK